MKMETLPGIMREVGLEVGSYQNNGCLYVGIVIKRGKFDEPFCNLTLNLPGSVPPYCGYVDIGNLPEAEDFIKEHGLGEFTGIYGEGRCNGRWSTRSYPLYMFDVEKLRSLCPDQMEAYEKSVDMLKVEPVTRGAR